MTEQLWAPAAPIWRHPEFRRGAREMVGVAMGIAAWGLVTGVAMVKSGLGVPLALLMSLVVFAGSAQLAALPLVASGAPIWVVWATAFCVNLRFVIFSAQWRPFFMRYPLGRRLALGYFTADLNYVMFMRRFQEPRDDEGQIEYFFGGPLSAELLLTIPQEHDVKVKGGPNLGSFKHLPPTLLLKYNFNPDGTFRPYVGGGVNLTLIMDVDLAVPGATPIPLDLDDTSVGFAVQAGFDWKLTDRWFLSADAKWIDIDSDVKIKGTNTTVTDVAVDPLVLGLGVGYRF